MAARPGGEKYGQITDEMCAIITFCRIVRGLTIMRRGLKLSLTEQSISLRSKT